MSAPVVWELLHAWRRRGLPRAQRSLLRGVRWLRACPRRAARGVGRGAPHLDRLWVALGWWALLASAPWWRNAIGSPVWGQCAAELARRVLGWKLYLTLAVMATVSWLLGPTSPFGLVLIAPGATLLAGLVAREFYRHTSYARARDRFGVDGWADFWELHREVSAHAVRHLAIRQRRTLAAGLPSVPPRRSAGVVASTAAAARRAAAVERLPVTECGVWLGRSAVGAWWGLPCYAGHRDVIGLIAPPQTGKTALMIHHVIDHPGAVISTSTKPEVFLYTAALRRARYGEDSVEVFNPDNLGGLGSTLRWCPVRGCADPRLAATRAALLVGLGDGMSEDQRRWKTWAAGLLTGFLMIADLDGRTMADVAHWVYHPTNREHGAWRALELMRDDAYAARVPAEVSDALEQVLDLRADKTRDSVFFALRDAVGFMSDPTIAWLCTPAREEPSFDVEAFLDRRGTLYLLGSEDQQAGSGTLLAAFTGHLFATAKNLAAARGGRLDPGLLLSLDEAALITPVPLPAWVADAGGRNLTIEWSVQTPSQLADRWGAPGATTILNATNALMVFGGLKDDDDLEQISTWCGKRLELVPDPDGDGPGHAKFERVPVCPPDLVRLIPQWHALLVHRSTRTTLVRLWPGWARKDVRRAQRAHGAPLPVHRDPHPSHAAPARDTTSQTDHTSRTGADVDAAASTPGLAPAPDSTPASAPGPAPVSGPRPGPHSADRREADEPGGDVPSADVPDGEED